jgi:membrane protein implicated in regulation of membrane protease activity
VRPFLLYTLARVLMFAATWAVVWLVASVWVEWTSTTALWTALIALVVSAIASLVLLHSLRDRLALQVQERTDRLQQRIDASRRREDTDE